MITFPGAGDYYKAVQAPTRAFTVPKLQQAEFVWDALGPTLARGSSAVVFQAAVDGVPQALRCYIRNDASSRDRYSALGVYLGSHNLNPFVSGTIWLDSAIRVKGETWPVLQMGWIDGRTLNEYVDFLVAGSNAAALATLAGRWREMIALLQNSEFAHGDLQHGNVMVDQSGQLRLVDFDGVWIPQLAGQAPPTEYGHANYQHPGLHEWDRWLDTFSALVIYLSLVALSKDPSLWLALYNSKNLLFCKADFFPPFESQAWKQLAALHDPQVDDLVRRLQECCTGDWISDKSLETLLTQRAAPALPPPPVATELRWWEKQPGPSATSGSSASPNAPAGPGGRAVPGVPAVPGVSAVPGLAAAASGAPVVWPRPQGAPPAGQQPPAGQRPAAAASSAAAPTSLPAPPPLSAPLGVAGTGPMSQLRQTMAPAGVTWWTGPGSAPTQPPAGPPGYPGSAGQAGSAGQGGYAGPAGSPVPAGYGGSAGSAGSAGQAGQVPGQPNQPWGMPPAPRPSSQVAKPQQGLALGAVSLVLGLVLLFIGAANHGGILVLVGLAGAAWGVWRLVTVGGTNPKPPGQP
jgi:hypothetical protein